LGSDLNLAFKFTQNNLQSRKTSVPETQHKEIYEMLDIDIKKIQLKKKEIVCKI